MTNPEAVILGKRFAFKAAAVAKWMDAVGVSQVTDLIARYPGIDHAEAMERTRAEIWQFILDDAQTYVIPGCEKDKTRGPVQPDLF
ncbi:MAG: hypothetical protein Q8P46_00285 [Hyphomicrobiales bacterium]|nr:hypothetical protein [Hyphomicrobiales bacterium]